MTSQLLIKAFLLGIIVAAPIGPVGLLCLRKNASQNRWRGLCAALGMALAYGLISFCVLFGLKWVSGFLETYRSIIGITAGCALFFMGLHGHRSKDVFEKVTTSSTYWGDFASSFVMTFFNPVAFASFAVVLTMFNILENKFTLILDIEFSVLISCGAITFWLVVNELFQLIQKRSTSDWCRWISHGAAIGLMVFGIVIFITGIGHAFSLTGPLFSPN